MKTPVADFVRAYIASDISRLHMPGHKGRGPLGCEAWDLTEVRGADALYEATGIIGESEANAAAIFGTARTAYSTEGSSQCVRAMLRLASMAAPKGERPLIMAARNAHKSFVYGAALLDLDVEWLLPEGEAFNLCSCPVSPQALEQKLHKMPRLPTAVYLTSPDYLGGTADIAALAEICRRYGVLLLVDNAHGAYLHFLPSPSHPMDLGADLCCDSAHKTLPVLTGGAYLHVGRSAPGWMRDAVKEAMELFGSTSPSYLTLTSLDLCNEILASTFPRTLSDMIIYLEGVKQKLLSLGWLLEESDPLRLTIRATEDLTGEELSELLRKGGVECEYADPEFAVLMASPSNTYEDLERIVSSLGRNTSPIKPLPSLPSPHFQQACSLREALLSPREFKLPAEALGRICASASVSCPPAIPVVVPGERIDEAAVRLMEHYEVKEIAVLRN